MKHEEVASKMKPNPPGVMKRNNRLMLEIDKHNRSWNGKKYTYRIQKGRESLNSPKRGRDNDVALGKNEQEKS